MATFFSTNCQHGRKISILAKVCFAAKGVSQRMRQNEFLFKPTATNTRF